MQYESELPTFPSHPVLYVNCTTSHVLFSFVAQSTQSSISPVIRETCNIQELLGEMCTRKLAICNYVPQGYSSVFWVLTSSPSDGQVHVLILANHLDELSTLRWCLARGWLTEHKQPSLNRWGRCWTRLICNKEIDADGHLCFGNGFTVVLYLTSFCLFSPFIGFHLM